MDFQDAMFAHEVLDGSSRSFLRLDGVTVVVVPLAVGYPIYSIYMYIVIPKKVDKWWNVNLP